jgi:arsenate reductase
MEDNVIIWHNPRCRKSREALAFLSGKNINHVVIEYLKDTPSVSEIEKVLNLLKVEPIDWVRKNEADFKDNFKGKQLTKQEWIKALADYPKLIERPVVIKGSKAVIARPADKIMEVL